MPALCTSRWIGAKIVEHGGRHRRARLRIVDRGGVGRGPAAECLDVGDDLDEPTRVLHRLPSWILAPLAPYERTGDVPNVLFPCGLVHDPESDVIRLYYGAADSSVCVATARLPDLLDAVFAAPADDD